MLDIHIIKLPERPYFLECISSVERAIEKAPFPVAVHVVDGVVGNMGIGRAKGFSLGTYPYQTYVDDDDTITEDALVELEEALMLSPDAVFTYNRVILPDGTSYIEKIEHALCVYKRGLLDKVDMERGNFMCDSMCRSIGMHSPKVVRITKPLYNRHIRKING